MLPLFKRYIIVRLYKTWWHEMKKDKVITLLREEAHKKRNKQALDRYYNNKSECQAQHRIWMGNNPLKVLEANRQRGRKGGKYYEKHLRDAQTGLTGARNKVRCKDRRKWREYKRIIAPESQLHHEWVPETAEYRGVALVEKDQHMHGIVDVIEILDGEITLLTEEEIRKQKGKNKRG